MLNVALLETETGAAKEGRSTAGTEHGMVGVVQRKEPEDVGGENPRQYWQIACPDASKAPKAETTLKRFKAVQCKRSQGISYLA